MAFETFLFEQNADNTLRTSGYDFYLYIHEDSNFYVEVYKTSDGSTVFASPRYVTLPYVFMVEDVNFKVSIAGQDANQVNIVRWEKVNADGTPIVNTLPDNYESLFDIVAESGALFDPTYTKYRLFSIVRDRLTGKLYQSKKTKFDTFPILDPSLDADSWDLYPKNANSGVTDTTTLSSVTIGTDQTITSTKTFTKPQIIPYATQNNHSLNFGQAKDLFLRKNEKAIDSFKLNGFTQSSVRKPYSIVLTDENGYIDNTFFRYEMIVQPVTLIVSKTATGAFRSIQEAWNSLRNKVILSWVVIKVADDTWESTDMNAPYCLLEEQVFARYIKIIGNTEFPDKCVIKLDDYQTGFLCLCDNVTIDGFTITSKNANKSAVAIDAREGSKVVLGASMILDNLIYGVKATKNSYIYSQNVIVKNTTTGFYSESSVIDAKNSKALDCETGYFAKYNAVIYANNSEAKRNTIGYKTLSMSNIIALNTEVNAENEINYQDNTTTFSIIEKN